MPSTASSTANLVAAFERGLRDLGYTPGRNVAIDYRYTEGRADEVPALAAELQSSGARVIVTTTDAVAQTVAQKTTGIPIVIVNASDPVGSGLVKTLAQPAGRITGLTNLSPEISAKRVELLKESLPTLSRVIYLWSSKVPGALPTYREVETATGRLNLRVEGLEVQQPADIAAAFERLTGGGSTALLVQAPNPMLYTERARVCQIANAKRMPSMFNRVEYLAAGGLMSYGPDVPAMYRRAAAYVDKILKGAAPGELPVEQPTTFELALNLTTARLLGITVPSSLLARVDRLLD